MLFRMNTGEKRGKISPFDIRIVSLRSGSAGPRHTHRLPGLKEQYEISK